MDTMIASSQLLSKPHEIPIDAQPEPLVNYRVFRTICLIFSFISLGLTAGLIGPTLVHMEYVLDTNTQGMGLTFVGENFGYLIGAVFCGVLFDRWNQDFQFALGYTFIGISTALAPWSPNLYVYFGTMTVQNIFKGYIDSGALSYILYLWTGHRYKQVFVQLIHAAWSLGSFTCPFIALPFLSELPENNQFVESIILYSNMSQTNISAIDGYQTEADNATFNEVINLDEIVMVRHAYLTVGLANVTAAVLFVVAFCVNSPSLAHETIPTTFKDNNNSELVCKDMKQSTGNDTGHSYTYFKYIITFLIFLYTCMFFWHDYIIGVFISAFVIKGLGWPVHKGPLITSLYRASHGLGAILAVPTSMVLNATQMLIINMISTVVSLTLVIVATFTSEILMWLSIALCGLAWSSTFASIILWGTQYLKVNGAYGSLFLIASSTGGMTSSALVGYLFHNFTHMWVVYIALGSALINTVIFSILYVTGRTYHRKIKYNETSLADREKKVLL